MDYSKIQNRLVDSALDTALQSFWIALGGAILTGIALAILSIKRAPYPWKTAFGGALAAFAIVILTTAALVAFKRRGTTRPVGRKGFLDYRIQAARALAELNRGVPAFTAGMNRLSQGTAKDTKRLKEARNGGASDERTYAIARKTSSRMAKNAVILKLRAEKVVEDAILFTEGSEKWMEWALPNLSVKERIDQASALESLHTIVKTTLVTMEGLRAAAEQNRHLSEGMDIAGVSVIEAVDTFIKANSMIEMFCLKQSRKLRRAN